VRLFPDVPREDDTIVEADLDPLLERSMALFHTSLEIADVLQRTCEEASRARQEAWAARVRAKSVRDQSAALRRRFDEGVLRTSVATPVRWFSLTGELGDRLVWARWQGGRLRCDPNLMTQARLLVELGTVFENHDPPARVEATVTGDPAAVMLTLARSCDRVVAVDFSREPAL
jgi:hypothetical protein